ncbi:Nuclear factor interleukin-3-regulated protein [Oryzias melastigma]|uniref:Nuclear factor interleukin-3-regulated protein n=1 Tax=Oryzias melastigma TaxID=30732 RepID=A0A834FC69_ORYME|nr:Nuclear factor interleukin-3-regulated protein [Oryzias melastigma]
MQSIKQEEDCGEYGPDRAAVLAVALQGPDGGHSLPPAPFKAKSSCRRKREFIPEEKKDTLYWERRRKNNEAAKRSREKRRINDMVLENQLLALGEENAALRAELLSLKLRFGLLSAAAYSKEVQKLVPHPPVSPFPDPALPGSARGVVSREEGPLQLRSSCISVIRHSPLMDSHALCGGAGLKQEPEDAGCAREEGGPYKLYQQCVISRLSGVCCPPASFLQVTGSSSNSPRSSDDCAMSKSSDGEDEQQVPSAAGARSVIVSALKVPEAGLTPSSAALPHKLRLKSRSVHVKAEVLDPEYEAAGRSAGLQNQQAPPCPLSEQLSNMQDWTQRPHSTARRPNPSVVPVSTSESEPQPISVHVRVCTSTEVPLGSGGADFTHCAARTLYDEAAPPENGHSSSPGR